MCAVVNEYWQSRAKEVVNIEVRRLRMKDGTEVMIPLVPELVAEAIEMVPHYEKPEVAVHEDGERKRGRNVLKEW